MKSTDKVEPEIIAFKTPGDFEKWLTKNHVVSKGIWIRFFKKGSGEKTITYQEALDEALCYGWIDGQLKKYDEQSWLHRFSPRNPKSIWSKKNTEHIERLTKLGKMRPAGSAEVEKAKADGRWEKAYDSPGKMTIPDDFMKLLNRNKKAKAFFATLNRANLYSIAWRLQTAKKQETRTKRMQHIIEMLARGEKFH
jgi:uncharacterized protein YdeI (YjbR/CyaY-like superfamily)